jgi:hypothetical protein
VEAGGWARVRDRFTSDYVSGMRINERRFMILLIDFDGNTNRLQTMRSEIPGDLTDRVFILGALTTPEALRQSRAVDYETIGRSMADDCRNGTQEIWSHDLLRHNEAELTRLRSIVCDILFRS